MSIFEEQKNQSLIDELHRFDDNNKLIGFTINNDVFGITVLNRKTKQVIKKSLELKLVENSIDFFHIDVDPVIAGCKIVWVFGKTI